MKKIIASAVVVVILALTVCSCGAKKVTCDICGKKVSEDKATVSEVLGEEVAICDDCASGNINIG